MSPRTLALTAGAAVILGGLVYLFVQVQADPAPSGESVLATRSERTLRPSKDPAPDEKPVTPAAPQIDRIRLPMTGAGPAVRVDPEKDPAGEGDVDPDVSFEAAMDEANKAYDRSDYEAAFKQAVRTLEKQPDNVRMLRVAVSSACLMGDADNATKHYAALPYRDQAQMTERCARFDIKLAPTRSPVERLQRAGRTGE